MKTATSLSRRLLTILIVTSIGYWLVVVGFMISNSVDETYELFDNHLSQTALALLRVTDPDDLDPVGTAAHVESPDVSEIIGRWPDLSARLQKLRAKLGRNGPIAPVTLSNLDPVERLYREYERRLRYQIWHNDGELLVKSANAPEQELTAADGFSESVDADGVIWRHYGVKDRHGTYRVVVSEANDVRNSLLRSIVLDLAQPLLLGLPVLLFLLWFSIRRGLVPLNRLAQEISRRRATTLSPVDDAASPQEIRPMVTALNGLLGNVERALENERCFTANAAHELRTPLAAIQAHLAAARAAPTAEAREQSLDQLQRGLERGIRLVDQLLALARLDPEQALPSSQRIDIGDLLESVCAEIAPLALNKAQHLELNASPDLPRVSGNAAMLGMLFTNIVDNAIRYTQEQGTIRVDARSEDGGVLVAVTDSGPGIPVAERQRVFERFCRLADQRTPGNGLGLTICRRVAELHGATIELADGPAGKGLSVSVRFPAAAEVS